MPPLRIKACRAVSVLAIARHQQAAAGVAVEPMHQLQSLARPRRSQRLDHAEAHAAAAVHGDAGGLVDHQQMLVLKNDCSLDQFDQAVAERGRARACAARRPRCRTGGRRTSSPS